MDVLQALGLLVSVGVLGLGTLYPSHLDATSPAPEGSTQAIPKAPLVRADIALSLDVPTLVKTCTPQAADATAPTMQECVQAELQKVLSVRGAEAAFTLLEQATTQIPGLAIQDHNMAHQLGRYAETYVYATTTEALRHCPFTMASGCFHGVLEAHYSNVGPPTKASDVTALCPTKDGRDRLFQCLHGLGHGLSMVADHDLPQTLAWCDFFGKDTWSRESCEGGAFMENVIGDTTMVHDHDHGMHTSTWVRFKPEDPLYPCDAVNETHWFQCYWMQTSVMLHNGYTFPQVFAACDTAPAKFVAACYQSAGRDISGATQRVHGLVTRDCKLGQETHWADCIYGATQEIVNHAADAAPGLAYCPDAPASTQATCHRAVGVMLTSIQPTEEGRRQACAASMPQFLKDCLDGAQVPPAQPAAA